MIRTIRWKLTISSLLAIGIPLLVFSYVLATLLWDFYLDQLQQELQSKAHVITESVAPTISPATPDDPARLANIVARWRRYSDMRVTVVDSTGMIRAATVTEDVGTQFDEAQRPGLTAALADDPNSTVWKSPNFGYEDTMYVNLPVREGDRVIGAVRVAYSLTHIQQSIRRIRTSFLASVALYALLIVLLTVWLADTMARPVEKLNRSAQILASGDLSHRVDVKGTVEVTSLADTLNRMTDRLQQLEGMRRQYVSNVSHELRTPLAALRGMAETLMEHGKADPGLSDRYLPRMIIQTERLARLASQLLDLAQIESGNLIHSFERLSLATVVDDVTHTCAKGAADRGVSLQTDVPEDLPAVTGDRDRLVQVFLNLVDNAVRHTPQGGEVWVTARAEGDGVTAVVADTGVGIPEEHLPHIFDRFYRVDQARTRQGGGTGLGLSIVKQIVEAHGGTIHVESSPGRGTQFKITLRLDEDAPPARERVDEGVETVGAAR